MGVYIKKVQASKVEAIFKMLGLSIKDGDIIEVSEPHGRLIDADALVDTVVFHTNISADTKEFIEDLIGIAPTVIEAEVKDEADEPVR